MGTIMSEQITHNDVDLMVEALRAEDSRLRARSRRRDAVGPRNAQYRAALRARARRSQELALIVQASGPDMIRGQWR